MNVDTMFAKPTHARFAAVVPPGAARRAVIGISGRYPSAPDLAAFWANLAAGKDAVSEIPEGRWALSKQSLGPVPHRPGGPPFWLAGSLPVRRCPGVRYRYFSVVPAAFHAFARRAARPR